MTSSKKKSGNKEREEKECHWDCYRAIVDSTGHPLAQVRADYWKYLSAHQAFVVSKQGRKLEDAVENMIRSEILPIFPGSSYERQSKSPDGDSRNGANPVDGVMTINKKFIIGVDTKVSGKAGGLQQILTQEFTALTARYSGRAVRMLLVGGPSMSFNGWLSDADWLMCLRLDDKESKRHFLKDLKFWLLGVK